MIYIKLFITFFKIGLFTFGGGYAMLPLIQAEVMENKWMTQQQIVDFIAVSESTPGPFAVNISTYVGISVSDLFGAFCATLGVVMPSFIIILLIAGCFEKFRENIIVKGCLSGLKPAVVGLIGAAAVSIGKTVFMPNGFNSEVFVDISTYISLVVFIFMSVLAVKKKHPILIICLSALIGIVTGYM